MRLSGMTAICGLSAITLAACTNYDGTSNRTGTGAALGAATGAAIGNLVSDDRTTGTLVGGALGGIVGGGIGNALDRQHAELQQSVGGSGAQVVNTGTELIVSLPEAITFPVSSSDVQPGIRDELIAISQSLQTYPNSTVRVIGHTDNTGSVAYNQALSERRAQSVANILVAAGTPSGRISTVGVGMSQPVATNDTEAGRAANRRVDIVITPQGQA